MVPMKRRKMVAALASTVASACLLLSIGSRNAGAEPRREVAAGLLVIVNAWMPQPLQGGKTGVIYLKIENRGGDSDELVQADSPGAQELMLHQSKDSGGVMKMMPLKSIEIPGHGEIELKPMGIHLMATGLKTVVKQSDKFPIRLTFRRAGPVFVDVVVQAHNALKPSS